MHTIRRARDRGHADFGWLRSRHTFSFGDYHDPRHMGFGPLRVINEDRVEPAKGFGPHSHHDMEVLSWVLEGTLEHRDSLGTGALIRPGELQRMTAGTGVTHSECNASRSDPVHFLQIWIRPDRRGLAPDYEQRSFTPAELRNRWRLLASSAPREGAVTIHQDVDLHGTRLDAGRQLPYTAAPGRRVWLQVARGAIELDGDALHAGDGAAWAVAEPIHVNATRDAELLLFDMTR